MSKETSGEWFTISWNPINGRCPNACDYCYMWGKGGFGNRFAKIHDHPLCLNEKILNHIPKSGRVFVGSSTDMWVDEVPDEWIEKVLWRCRSSKAEFFYLTKKPMRYLLIYPNLPIKNCWYGATWDGTGKTVGNMAYIVNLAERTGANTYISFEPVLSKPDCVVLPGVKWIIIGADSRKGKPKPPKEWADYLIQEARRVGAMVFVKENYGYPEKIKELPSVS